MKQVQKEVDETNRDRDSMHREGGEEGTDYRDMIIIETCRTVAIPSSFNRTANEGRTI